VPEILPINGKRIHVSYLGQLKQCRSCFGQGHIASTCEVDKVDWIEYVATLHKSGKFDNNLFEGWMPALKQFHSSYKEPTQDSVSVLDFGQPQRRQSNQNTQSSYNFPGPSNQANNQHGFQNTNQGAFQFNSNNSRGQYRPRGQANYQNNRGNRGQYRGRARGRGRGNQIPSSNFMSAYQ